MNQADDDLPPPARLAIAYAPRDVRAALALLLRFDARFAAVVGNASEPLIGQMKLAWWRDAIMAAVDSRPKGEPMLSALFDLNEPVFNGAVVALADAWEALVVEQEWSAAAMPGFAQIRGQAIFGTYSALCHAPDFSAGVAERWAVDDLRLRFGNRVPDIDSDNEALPTVRSLRPLTILAMSVRGVSGPRLIWHALTGR